MKVRLFVAVSVLASVLASACATGRATVAAPLGQSTARPGSTQAVAEQKAGGPVNASAAILQDFSARIAAYVAVHKKAAGDGAAIKESADATRIKDAQTGLTARIQTARATAKAGDIFTPEIRTAFRRLMYPELKGEDGRDARAVIKDDGPASVPLKVNAKYPDGAPLPTVPANLLINLPQLPKELEYRIINTHLILLDVDASLIVDYIPNAIQ